MNVMYIYGNRSRTCVTTETYQSFFITKDPSSSYNSRKSNFLSPLTILSAEKSPRNLFLSFSLSKLITGVYPGLRRARLTSQSTIVTYDDGFSDDHDVLISIVIHATAKHYDDDTAFRPAFCRVISNRMKDVATYYRKLNAARRSACRFITASLLLLCRAL